MVHWEGALVVQFQHGGEAPVAKAVTGLPNPGMLGDLGEGWE